MLTSLSLRLYSYILQPNFSPLILIKIKSSCRMPYPRLR
nr:MAG TPA: hypothetical protein [Caudoviricetes sp.]